MALVREFAASQSERAFEALVARHIHLVHSAALRRTRDAHLAEEITQAVFIILVRKAKSLGEKTILSGWLYRTAQFVAADALKMQRRRQRRGQEAHMQSILENSPNETTWNELSPLLDEAMMRLRQADRDAIVLRYFENKNLSEVGDAMGLQERAAQKRIARALEKLRTFFEKRGVASTTAIIAGVISENSVHAAPIALTKTISAVAIAKGVTVVGSTLALAKGALKIMASSKAKTAIVAGAVVLLAAGTTTVTVKEIQEHKTYPWEVPKADFNVFYKAPAQVRIIPTKFSEDGGWCVDSSRGALGIAQPLKTIIYIAYSQNKFRTVVDTTLPTNKYDLIAKLVPSQEPHKDTPINTNWTVELQKEITKKFGVEGHLEMRNTDVLVLQPSDTGIRGINVSHKMPKGEAVHPIVEQAQSGLKLGFAYHEQPLSTLVSSLENHLQIPVVYQTGLTQEYDYLLTWNDSSLSQTNLGINRNEAFNLLDSNLPNFENLRQALLDQLGLELVATNMPIEMLVVEKAN